MAIDYDIGGKKFVLITGQVTGFREHLEVVSRAGVDGVQVIWQGARSEPFTLITVVDAKDLADADTKFQNYERMIGVAYTPLVIAGLDYTASHNAKVLIRNVKKQALQRVHSWVGALATDSTAILIAEWEVQLLRDREE